MIDPKTAVMMTSTIAKTGTEVFKSYNNTKQEKNALAHKQKMDTVRGAIDCLGDVAIKFIDYLNIAEQEKTKREMIANWKEVSLEKIAAQKQFLMQYLDKTFEERKENFSHFFNALDKGIESGNIEIVNAALNGIVDLAKTSPLKAEVSQVLAAIDNTNITEFKF